MEIKDLDKGKHFKTFETESHLGDLILHTFNVS